MSPDEVKADVEQIRDENAKRTEATKDSIDNPLGALGRSLAGGLMVSRVLPARRCLHPTALQAQGPREPEDDQ